MTNTVFSSASGQRAVPPGSTGIKQRFESCLFSFECSVFTRPQASSVRRAGLQSSGS